MKRGLINFILIIAVTVNVIAVGIPWLNVSAEETELAEEMGLLEDSFDDGFKWNMDTTYFATNFLIKEYNGNNVLYSNNKSSYTFATTGSGDWEDYSVSVKYSFLEKGSGWMVGIGVRTQDNGGRYQFSWNSDGSLSIAKYKNTKEWMKTLSKNKYTESMPQAGSI